MTALRDPSLPAGAIVEVFDDGGALRNDGVRLKAAAKNPWYVLATVAGETLIFHNPERDALNRRFWNGWMCRRLGAEERVELAKKLDLPLADLAPLNENELQQLNHRFAGAFSGQLPIDTVPKENERDVDFSKTYFDQPLKMNRFHIAGYNNFEFSHFAKEAIFTKASFEEEACFREAYFKGNSIFNAAFFAKFVDFRKAYFAVNADYAAAHFVGGADFVGAQFAGIAAFNRVHFAMVVFFRAAHFTLSANFNRSHFARGADFSNAHFARSVHFSDGEFKGATHFDNTHFASKAPTFFQREMHQYTTFSEDPSLWPIATPENANHGKQAYTRLRQIAAGNQNPDLEHFFLRQEMRCKEVLARGVDRWAFGAYRFFADYGISFAWPAFWLMAVWGAGCGVIGSYLKYSNLSDGPVADGFMVSLGNTLPFINISERMHQKIFEESAWWIDALSAVQSLFGIILLFFIGLGLRNRFRLK